MRESCSTDTWRNLWSTKQSKTWETNPPMTIPFHRLSYSLQSRWCMLLAGLIRIAIQIIQYVYETVLSDRVHSEYPQLKAAAKLATVCYRRRICRTILMWTMDKGPRYILANPLRLIVPRKGTLDEEHTQSTGYIAENLDHITKSEKVDVTGTYKS